jgi:hypothetical protein
MVALDSETKEQTIRQILGLIASLELTDVIFYRLEKKKRQQP